MFDLNAIRAFLPFSTKTTDSAPLDNASNPKDPDPAYRSATTASETQLPKEEKTASLTRSATGRVPLVSGALIRLPRATPPMILMWRDPASPDEQPFDLVTEHRPDLADEIGVVFQMRIGVDETERISPCCNQQLAILEDVAELQVFDS